MKTKEEYLLVNEARLIDRLIEDYKSINKNIISTIIILFLYLLFENEIIKEVSIIGNQLYFAENIHLLLFPWLIIIFYLMINFQIASIEDKIVALENNSQKILEENKLAVPFVMSDISYYAVGIMGLQLRYTKSILDGIIYQGQTNYRFSQLKLIQNIKSKLFLKFTIYYPLSILYKIFYFIIRIIKIVGGIFNIIMVYIIPLVVPLVILLKKCKTGSLDFDFINIFTVVMLVGLIIYTLINNILFHSFHFLNIFLHKDRIVEDRFDRIEYYFETLKDGIGQREEE